MNLILSAIPLLGLKALTKKLKEAKTKAEEEHLKELIKELKLSLEPSDRQPGIENANDRETPTKSDPRYFHPIGKGTFPFGKLRAKGGIIKMKSGGAARRGYGKARR
jgi:hypothetical protein